MEEQAMVKAFDAIHDEAARLLAITPDQAHDLRGGLQLIMSLARYKHDIRSVQEIEKARAE